MNKRVRAINPVFSLCLLAAALLGGCGRGAGDSPAPSESQSNSNSAAASDEQYSIELQVESQGITKTATHGGDSAERPLLEVPARGQLQVRWSVVRESDGPADKDVTVHFFLAKESSVGQAKAPALREDVAVESALTVDFAEHAKSSADFSLQIPPPGVYQMRVETIGTQGQHAAVMDVRVE